MNNKEYLNLLYKNILQRDFNAENEKYHLNQLENGVPREFILKQFFDSVEFKNIQSSKDKYPDGHYYSPIPSSSDRKKFTSSYQNISKNLTGINFNLDQQLNNWKKFNNFLPKFRFPSHKSSLYDYFYINDSFGLTDAFLVFSFLLYYKPKRIIEVGSGMSSCLLSDINRLFFNYQIEITLVEPNPNFLYSVLTQESRKKFNIIEKKVQSVSVNDFKLLKSNDLLFIDSSHITKLGSDVNYLFFDIIPNLNDNVLVHIHDIFRNFDYPPEWVSEGRSWNEAYLLRAFLLFNSNFNIEFYTSYIVDKIPNIFENKYLNLKSNLGGCLWFRKTNQN